MKTTRFIFGIWPVRAFDYYWTYTIAQIELMLVDKPLVLYKDDKGADSKGGKPPSREEAERAYKEFMDRKEKERKGERLNINKWIKNG